MKKIAKIIIASMIAIAVISIVLTIFIPTHTGEIRQDLQIGDYYTTESNNLMTGELLRTEHLIIDFSEEDNLIVRSTCNGKSTEHVWTKDQFLNGLLFKDNSGFENVGYASLDTNYGSRFCTIYQNDDSQFWVGEHNIIYKTSVHGQSSKLVDTSLIIS